MAATISTFGKNGLLNAICKNTTFQIAAPSMSLHTADPVLTGANELPNSFAYARVACPFSAPSAGSAANSGAVLFGPVTGTNWSPETWGGLWDSGTYGGGNFLVSWDTPDFTVLVGEYAELAAGAGAVALTGIGTIFAANLLNGLLRNVDCKLTTLWASLHTGDPGTTGATELSVANGYQRYASIWGTVAAGAVPNTQFQSPAASGSDWAAANYIGFWDASSSGNFFRGATLGGAKTVTVGKVLRHLVGTINLSL